MTHSLKLCLLQDNRALEEFPLDQPVEVGRQRPGEPEPFRVQNRRLIITRDSDGAFFSRRHRSLEPLSSGLVRVCNHSKFPLEHDHPGSPLAPGAQADLPAPFCLVCQHIHLVVAFDEPLSPDGMNSLGQSTVPPGSQPPDPGRVLEALPALTAAKRHGLASWLQNFTNLLQLSLSSSNLFQHAAQAVVQLGLHSGCVLLLQGDDWTVSTIQGAAAALPGWKPSRQVLERLRQDKRTYFQPARPAAAGDSPSLQSLEAVIAAPLLDREAQVLGALYGERSRGGGPADALEAALVELLACAVAAGLERDRLMRSQAQLEQFFGEQLARDLQRDPTLLQARQAEVTLLFCDVRRFSTFCQNLKAGQITEWMHDVLSELSACVLAEDGVLVDYVGDEVLALWGAPRSQPDQAVRAVRAGLAMLREALPRLNERWQTVLGRPMEIGVGLNTGLAQVGNMGSRYKFKYAAQGDAVNLASRVQGLTKYLGCPLLATRATREKLTEQFMARRVCQARVVNRSGPADLYQVESVGMLDRREFFRDSEQALDNLERKEFVESARAAAPLLRNNPGDKPLLLILSRATHQLMYPEAPFDPAWEPPGK